eukprot:5327521-Pleurochrysis_carterae.AAC.1
MTDTPHAVARGATAGQTAVDGKYPRRACMTRCRAEPESVLGYSYSGPHQHSEQRPNGLGLSRAPPLHRWSHPSKA